MHFILLGEVMAAPVYRDSVLDAEEYLSAATDEITSFPSDDDISFPPSPSSSVDLPDIGELLDNHKRLRSIKEGSRSPLPKSSLPSSPASDGDMAMEEDFPSGRVHLYHKAGDYPMFFEIPSTNGFFSLLNCQGFVKQSRIVTHPLEVYDAMVGDFVALPPLAYWRQYSSDQYLIIREQGVNDKDCPGIDILIDDLEDPVDVMFRDPLCREIWRRARVNTPPSTQVPVVSSSAQCSTYDRQAVQTMGGQKRKRATTEDEVPVPPLKVLKSLKQGSGNTSDDPITVWDD